ncbi:hypothetical protein MPH47_14090 [Psychrobacillus psychrodurans]|uniref:hypothetical protein n=1 Tax=Psychrobacillus TaxID=1221880 RepID=UPI001F4D49D6|nr:hypothetical protein [Psychrobacillus psychrodurans]MCK1998330.1 hypothetical protein [Psychrobacillus psychrodurans]
MEQLFLGIVQSKNLARLYQFLMMVLVSMVPFDPIPVLATFIAIILDFGTDFLIKMLGTTTTTTTTNKKKWNQYIKGSIINVYEAYISLLRSTI